MLAVDIETAPTFAAPRQAEKFIAAMQRIAATRTPGTPVRVYLSAPPQLTDDLPRWQRRTAQVREQLPAGIEMLSYTDVIAQGLKIPDDWAALTATLDGLVLLPLRKGSRHSHVYRTGPQARNELRSLVAGKPTFIHAYEQGLVPIIDCYTRRRGSRQDQLAITVPKRWDRNSQTLKAALRALVPEPSDVGALQAAPTPHLAAVFKQPA
ncbi:hypothetical protein [Streptomyces sp. NRRL F-2890]|uniref:hypothetical protein n=1 Tax=Streptomyces sp. NRRL F-2890 TaxID=1463845 RepID=UPI000B23C1D2|nr:hypothetical protein [Streptomyces sp. NRRL F-2890]